MKYATLIPSILLGLMACLHAQTTSAPLPPRAEAHDTTAASSGRDVTHLGEDFDPLPVRVYALGFAFADCKAEECEKRQQEIFYLVGQIMKMADPKAKVVPDIVLSPETKVLVAKVTPEQQEIIAEMVQALKENAANPVPKKDTP
ncbi:hypothetical protein AYO49_04645 [Verrucomicrobiaceae bacterium SCGC AG-212-N21]|nr:hypothetical protein AYO49_04645 [Verrucomicrobiaceae bacterium SCGC AG-212-N21]